MKNIFTLKTDQKSNLYYNTNDKCFQVSEVLKDSTPLKENQFVYVTNEGSLTLGGYHFNSKYGDEPQKTNERDINWRKYWEEEDYEISKIVLTNDPQLVADGVQEINSSFLSFFAENKPEYVEVKEEIRAFDIQNDEVPYAIFDGDCTKTVYSLNFAEKDKKEECSNTQKKSLEANKQFIKNTSPEKLEELMKEFDNYETETLEETAEKYANEWEEIYPELDPENMTPIEISKIDFIAGVKLQQKRSYSKEEVINALHSVELKDNKDYSKIYKDMEKWLEQNKNKSRKVKNI